MLSLIQEASEQRWKEGDRVRYRPLLVLTASVCTRVSSTAASSMLVSETARENEKGRCTGQGVEGGHRRDGLQCICCCAEKLHCWQRWCQDTETEALREYGAETHLKSHLQIEELCYENILQLHCKPVFFNITDTTILLYFYFIYILNSYVYMYILILTF